MRWLAGYLGIAVIVLAGNAPQTAVASNPPAFPRVLWLDVILNQRPLGPALAALPAPGRGLWVEAATLRGWLGDPDRPLLTTSIDGTTFVALDPLPGVRYFVEPDAQELHLTLPASTLRNQVRGTPRPTHGPASVRRGNGVVVNYAVNAMTASSAVEGSQQSGAAVLDGLVFNRLGSLQQSWLWHSRLASPGVRLDSTWTTDWPEHQLRLTLGDAITPPDAFDQQLRFGGIQLRRAFETQPSTITFPVPVFTGVAELPSTVELYVDNIRRAQFDLEPGPYQIANPPVLTGAGTAQLVLTDVLGNTQVTALPFFVDPSLLRKGLTDFSVNAGALRNGYAERSADYADAITAGTVRHGLSDRMTLNASARWSAPLSDANVGAAWRAGDQTPLLLSGSIGGYRDGDGAAGSLVQVQASYRPRTWRLSAQSAATDPFSRARSTETPFRFRHLLQLGLTRGPWSADLAGLTRALGDGSRFSSVSLRFSYAPRHVFGGLISTELFHTVDHAQAQSDNGVRVFLSWSPRLTTSVTGSASGGSRPYQSVQISERSLNEIGGNYDLGLSRTDTRTRGYALGTARLSNVELDARAEKLSADQDVLALGGRGAFAWTHGHVVMGRQLRTSFALVDLNGLDGVSVYRENRLAGVSDADGLLMIPDLLEYQPNRLSLNPAQLPLDVRIGTPEVSITPGHLTGVPVEFELQRVLQATVHLQIGGGRAVPPGAQLTVNGRIEAQPVGQDGLAFLQHVHHGDNDVLAEWDRGRCALSVYYPKGLRDPLPDMGTRYCRPL